jgi:hypothetical protein
VGTERRRRRPALFGALIDTDRATAFSQATRWSGTTIAAAIVAWRYCMAERRSLESVPARRLFVE